MTVRYDQGSRSGRRRQLALAGGLAVAALAGFASPASAGLNIFSNQSAKSNWTNTPTGRTNFVELAPGADNYLGAVTQYLKTTITGTFCAGGATSALLTVNVTKSEQATLLAGVTLNTLAAGPTATVSRTTSFPGTITMTPTAGVTCGTTTGPAVTTSNPTLTVKGSWSKPSSATLITYSGSDCGGIGTCRYTDAMTTGSFTFGASTVTLGGAGSNQWLNSGTWDLNALCSPVPGYPCI